MEQQIEKHYSVNQVLQLLPISRSKLSRMTSEGEIEATRVGDRVLYSASAVNAVLGKGKIKTKKAA